MSAHGTPDLAAFKLWLGLVDPTDTQDDVVMQESIDSALDQQCRVVNYPVDGFGDPVFPDSLREAVFLRAQRLTARRNSPEGVVGLALGTGDFVSARVPAYDSDVASLEAPFRKIAVS